MRTSVRAFVAERDVHDPNDAKTAGDSEIVVRFLARRDESAETAEPF